MSRQSQQITRHKSLHAQAFDVVQFRLTLDADKPDDSHITTTYGPNEDSISDTAVLQIGKNLDKLSQLFYNVKGFSRTEQIEIIAIAFIACLAIFLSLVFYIFYLTLFHH